MHGSADYPFAPLRERVLLSETLKNRRVNLCWDIFVIINCTWLYSVLANQLLREDKPTPTEHIRGTQDPWRERLMFQTAASTDRLARQMPVRRPLYSSCPSFVFNHPSLFFPNYFLPSCRFIMVSPDKNTLYLPTQVVYLYIVEAIIYLKLLWRVMCTGTIW